MSKYIVISLGTDNRAIITDLFDLLEDAAKVAVKEDGFVVQVVEYTIARKQ